MATVGEKLLDAGEVLDQVLLARGLEHTVQLALLGVGPVHVQVVHGQRVRGEAWGRAHTDSGQRR